MIVSNESTTKINEKLLMMFFFFILKEKKTNPVIYVRSSTIAINNRDSF